MEVQKEVFDKCRNYIVQNLSPDGVVDHLISQHLIGDSAHEQLRLPIKTAKEKNRIIVDELSTGGPGTLEKFCTILKISKRTEHIADNLEKGTCVYTINDIEVNLYYAHVELLIGTIHDSNSR